MKPQAPADAERAREELTRRVEKRGRRLAWGVALAAVALGLAGIRLEGPPAGRGATRAPKVRWGGDGEAGMRAVLDPTVYALAGRTGFTGGWRGESPSAAALAESGAREGREGSVEPPGWPEPELAGGMRPYTGGRARPGWGTPVFGDGAWKEKGGMRFPDGWEARMFSGVELDFADWAPMGWRARAEVEFDGEGRPVHVFLTRKSGLPEVDARLARGVRRWRLLEGSAMRRGEVEWVATGG